ncbi:MAG: hypothetical protein KIT14_22610 [bacterium]|nr:hypothetical protein [bacterium]
MNGLIEPYAKLSPRRVLRIVIDEWRRAWAPQLSTDATERLLDAVADVVGNDDTLGDTPQSLKQAIEAARGEIDEARSEIEDARSTISDAQDTLHSAERKLGELSKQVRA